MRVRRGVGNIPEGLPRDAIRLRGQGSRRVRSGFFLPNERVIPTPFFVANVFFLSTGWLQVLGRANLIIEKQECNENRERSPRNDNEGPSSINMFFVTLWTYGP